MQAINNPQSLLPASLRFLAKELKSIRNPYPDELPCLVERANVKPEDLEPWADRNHPPAHSYGRKLVMHGGHFEIMVMTWLPGDYSAIHDHGEAQWGAVQCFGVAAHQKFSLNRQHLSLSADAPYRPRQINWVDHNLIHQMGNTGSQTFLSLHIYGAGRTCANLTSCSRLFDLDEGCIQITDGGVFFALPEAQIIRRHYGLSGDQHLVKQQRLLKKARQLRALELTR